VSAGRFLTKAGPPNRFGYGRPLPCWPVTEHLKIASMQYKVLKGSALFEELSEVYIRMEACNAAACQVMEEVDADGFAVATTAIAGGIRAFRFDGYHVPQNWHATEKKPARWWFPDAVESNQVLLEKIAMLPTVLPAEINALLHFRGGTLLFPDKDGYYDAKHLPILQWAKEYILLEFPEGRILRDYEPRQGMMPITELEFVLLADQIK